MKQYRMNKTADNQVVILEIRAVNPTALADTLNEALRELASTGVVNDADDDGWQWFGLDETKEEVST